MTTDETIAPPAAKSPRKIAALAILPMLFVSGMGFGSLFLKTSHDPDDSAEHSRTGHSEEPITKSIDRLIRNQEFAAARDLCESEDADPEDRGIRFRWAVCMEQLASWKRAAGAYENLATQSSDELAIHANLGLVRCRLADQQLDLAAIALSRLNSLDLGKDPRILEEHTRLKACMLYAGLGIIADPDPLDSNVLAWPKAVEYRQDRTIWLPPSTTGDESPRERTHPIAVPAETSTHLTREDVRDALASVLTSQDHPTIRLALANMDRQDGRRVASDEAYRQILQDYPDSIEAMMASYNLGLAYLKDGAIALAREAFLGVVDRDPNGPWGELGRFWIGRCALDGDDPVGALRSFRIAAASSSRRLRAAAGFGWALARLREDNDDAFERIVQFLEPDTSPLALETTEFFRMLLRYRNRPSPLRAEQLGKALVQAQHLKPLGPAGVLVAGRVWTEIGETKKAVELYDSTGTDFRGPLRIQILFASAEGWRSMGRLSEARQRYLTVAAVDDRELGLDAELRLAEMAVNEGQGAEGLKRAYRVWKSREIESEPLLRIMGRGFEQIGDPLSAAMCFSGRVPKID